MILFFTFLIGLFSVPVYAQSGIRIISNQAKLQFPESVTFNAEIQSQTNISSVVLEYGVDQLTCSGMAIAKAFPIFSHSPNVQVEWTWEMRQSGSLPPGAQVWWRWKISDQDGNQSTSPKQTISWLDDQYEWETLSGGNVNLHWYDGGTDFGQELHDAATQALTNLKQEIGLQPDKTIDIYIYANTQDMQEAILYEPYWSGGLTFVENSIIIIGVSPDIIDWGKSTITHELTHALVGRATYTCLGFFPTWLNEGLAVYSEGGSDDYEQNLFDQAVTTDTLMSINSLSGGFPESERGYLAYAESYSVVNFLISTYGRNKINTLLSELREGATADEALIKVYGFNVGSLDDAWRVSIGLTARGSSSSSTPIPTATIVPTIIPFSGSQTTPSTPIPPPITASLSTPANTSGTSVDPQSATTANPNLSAPLLADRLGISQNILTMIEFAGACTCISVALVAGPIYLTVRRRPRRAK